MKLTEINQIAAMLPSLPDQTYLVMNTKSVPNRSIFLVLLSIFLT